MAESDQDFDDIFAEDQTDEAAPSDADIFSDLDESAPARPRAPGRGTVKIGKETFAVGLNWNATTEDGGKPADQAKLAAKDDAFKAQFYCLRESSAWQYGLGRKEMGHRAGQRALAAVVADKLSGNWLAAFEIDQDYYLVAHRDDLILSDYDRLLSKELEAKDLFSDLFYSADWDTVVAPSSWGMDGTQPTPISGLIEKGKLHKLKPVGSLQAAMPLIMGGVVLGGVALGAITMMPGGDGDFTYVPPEGFDAPMERMRGVAEEAIKPVTDLLGEPEEEEVVAEVPPQAPWIGRPNGVGLLLACTADIKSAPLDVPGWETTSVVCGDSLRIGLRRAGGNTLWAETYFRDRGQKVDFSRSIGGDALAHSYPVSFVSPYDAEFDTPEISEVQRYLGYQFEEFGLPLSFTERSGTTSKIDRYYEAANFSFETDLEPVEFADLFTPIPGLLINEISFDLENSVWSVSGSYYHKRDTPIPAPQTEGFEGGGQGPQENPEY